MSPGIPYRYIAIEGNIGSGKTSLAGRLAADLEAKLILEEFEDNSFLPKFYEDGRRFAFPLELSFLASRFNQLKSHANPHDLFGSYMVSDYMFAKCLLFSKINLDDDEYSLYIKLFNIINLQLPQPDLIIYLHSPVSRLRWNISLRGRPYEQEIGDDYLQKIQEEYFSYLKMKQDVPVLAIDCSAVDFIADNKDYRAIYDLIGQKHSNGMHNFNIST